MLIRQTCRRHVFRDLRPYICTFEDCQNGGKLYVSRHEWMYHELQIHRRKYICNRCPTSCPTRKAMETHLREHYSGSIHPAQWAAILDLCDRPLEKQNTGKEQCFICREELPSSTLQEHLATHMEEVSLFVLP
ncbi:hypothetical protein GQ53DRAFT_665989, partial [Thozetella sp. PMI_491]